MNQRMHTGCSCKLCRRGMKKQHRREFHRKLRQRQKRQLKRFGDIIDVTLSIGYTDLGGKWQTSKTCAS